MLQPAALKEVAAMIDALKQRIKNIKILAEPVSQIEMDAITAALQNKIPFLWEL